MAEARLHDAQITTVARSIARRDRLEQTLRQRIGADGGDRLTTGVQIAPLAKRDKLFDDRTQFLGFRKRRRDLLMLDERSRDVGKQSLAMADGAVQPAAGTSMTHEPSPSVFFIESGLPRLSIDLRSAWRGLRCSPAASPALPCQDAGPWRRALP